MLKKNCFSLLSFSSTIMLVLATNQSFASKDVQAIQNTQGLLYNAVTIGSYTNSSGGTAPFAYYNRGAKWKLSSPLSLPSDVIESPNKQVTFLNGVSCDKKSKYCVAVGSYATNAEGRSAPGYAPLSYFTRDGGANWQLSTTLPLPADVSMPADTQSTALNGVTCNKLDPQLCASVGYYINDQGASAPLSYITTNGGEKWTVSDTLPLPADVITPVSKQRSKLYGVACTALNSQCSAVGSYINNLKSTVPFIYSSTNQGQSWVVNKDPLPLPDDALTNNQNSTLLAVSCDRLGIFCNATGYYTTNTSSVRPLSYYSFDGGVTWNLSDKLPLPSDVITQQIAQNTRLNSVFCNGFGWCNAVGYYTNTSGTVAPLSYISIDGGKNWIVSASTLPLPSNAATGLLANSGLFGVFCDRLKILCTAVGYYKKNDGTGIAPLSYISFDAGATWEVRPDAPLPTDTATKNQMARFNSIS